MTEAKRDPPRLARPRARTLPRVVERPPSLGPDVQIAGQGQRLFQLFREDLMREFASRPALPKRR